MIRIAVMSDLHLEFGQAGLPMGQPVEANLVVLAGDTHTKRRGPAWAAQCFPSRPVVMIGGNHEAYGDSLWANIAAHRQRAARLGLLPDGRQHVVFLEREAVVLDGVRVLGATLWTDFSAHGLVRRTEAMAAARVGANDYRQIRRRRRPEEAWDLRPPRLEPSDTAAIHALTCAWLAEQLREPHPGPTVVITHHAPSVASLASGWQADPLAAAYASNLESLICRFTPDLWVHGHIHQSQDYQIGRTRIVANPRGYAGVEENPAFVWGKTIEI